MFIKQFHAKVLLVTVLAVLQDTVESTISTILTDLEGTVMSPGFPEPYPDNYNEIWQIRVPPGHVLKLEFDYFDLEDECECDYVLIDDKRYCGSEKPPTFISSKSLIIVLKTDASVSGEGFSATYTISKDDTTAPSFPHIIEAAVTSTESYSTPPSTESSVRSIPGVLSTEANLTLHILRNSHSDTHTTNKWGSLLPRIAMTLFLTDHEFFALGNRTGEEIAYELSLQLISKLTLKKSISTKDLALYINALTVACIDPKDFFGVNLVYELRKRVNSSNYTHPFSVLTLCNAKDNMTMEDVNKLQQLYNAHFRPVWTDTQAMVVMALSCIHSRSDLNLSINIDDMASELKKKQHKNGTIDNLKTTALVVQALLAAETYRTDFDFNAAIKFILQEVEKSYPNQKLIYYILPIFNYRSLAAINSDHCVTSAKTGLQMVNNVRENPSEVFQVQISVIVGEDKDFIRTWKVKAPLNSTFYEVLENIGDLEPAYRVQYSISGGKPYIAGIAKFQDDAEDGLFWFIYTKQLSSTENPKLVEQSPVDIQVRESEEMMLWYRPGFWESTEGSTSR